MTPSTKKRLSAVIVASGEEDAESEGVPSLAEVEGEVENAAKVGPPEPIVELVKLPLTTLLLEKELDDGDPGEVFLEETVEVGDTGPDLPVAPEDVTLEPEAEEE